MTARQPGMSEPFIRLYAGGWIISLCLHGSAIVLAGFFVARIGLAPPSSTFHWDVTVIGSHPPAPTTSPSPSTQAITPTIARPAQRSASVPSTRPKPSQTPLPTEVTTASTSMAADDHPAEPAFTPHRQVPQQPLEPTRAVPASEPQEARQEPQTPRLATAAQGESSPAAPSPSHTAVSPLPEVPLTSESSSPIGSTHHLPDQPTAPAQTASLAPSTNRTQMVRKPDYGWLTGPLLQRIDALKQYPVSARLHRLEGRVVVRIVIQEDGQIVSAAIAKSSGHDVLDQAALETLRQVSPIALSQPLDKTSVTMQIPLGYYLDR